MQPPDPPIGPALAAASRPGLDAMDAELLDRPVGQGLRAQQSQPPTAALVILDDGPVAAGIVGRPLTQVRTVEQPGPTRPTQWIPWTSLVLSIAALLTIGATLAVLTVPPAVGAMVVVCVAMASVVLVIAETVSKVTR